MARTDSAIRAPADELSTELAFFRERAGVQACLLQAQPWSASTACKPSR